VQDLTFPKLANTEAKANILFTKCINIYGKQRRGNTQKAPGEEVFILKLKRRKRGTFIAREVGKSQSIQRKITQIKLQTEWAHWWVGRL
jgi:hypothetical protein